MSSAASISIRVNGEPHEVPQGTTLADLLSRLNRNPRLLAVERNLSVVPRTHHAECLLVAGDELEIVTLVGGG